MTEKEFWKNYRAVRAKLLLKLPNLLRIKLAYFKTELIAEKDPIPTGYAAWGDTIFIRISTWEQDTTECKMASIAHEVLHLLLDHTNRGQKYNKTRYNIAADYVINNGLLEMGFQLDDSFIVERKYVGMSTEQVYKLLEKEQADGNAAQDGRHGDITEEPQQVKDMEPKDRDTQSAEAQTLMEELREATSQDEKLVGALRGERTISFGSKRGFIPWNVLLANEMLKTPTQYLTYSRINRRYTDIDRSDFIFPSITGKTLDSLLIGIDVSGSITDEVVTQFLTEVNHLLNIVAFNKVELFTWALSTSSILTFSKGEALTSKRLSKNVGTGGTDIGPVLKLIGEKRPTVSIIFTDGWFQEPTNIPSFVKTNPPIYLIDPDEESTEKIIKAMPHKFIYFMEKPE